MRGGSRGAGPSPAARSASIASIAFFVRLISICWNLLSWIQSSRGARVQSISTVMPRAAHDSFSTVVASTIDWRTSTSLRVMLSRSNDFCVLMRSTMCATRPRTRSTVSASR